MHQGARLFNQPIHWHYGIRSGEPDLFKATRMSCQSRATDLRDKVYSLLGVLKGKESRFINPDYTTTVSAAYTRATFVAIECSWSLDILELAKLGRSSVESLPSWAADFSQTNEYWNALFEDTESRFYRFGKTRGRVIRWPFDPMCDCRLPQMGSHLDFLSLRGTTLSTIGFASPLPEHTINPLCRDEKPNFKVLANTLIDSIEQAQQLLRNLRLENGGITKLKALKGDEADQLFHQATAMLWTYDAWWNSVFKPFERWREAQEPGTSSKTPIPPESCQQCREIPDNAVDTDRYGFVHW